MKKRKITGIQLYTGARFMGDHKSFNDKDKFCARNHYGSVIIYIEDSRNLKNWESYRLTESSFFRILRYLDITISELFTKHGGHGMKTHLGEMYWDNPSDQSYNSKSIIGRE